MITHNKKLFKVGSPNNVNSVNMKSQNMLEGVKLINKPKRLILRKDILNMKTNRFLHSKPTGLFVLSRRIR